MSNDESEPGAPRVLILIVNWNGAEVLGECLSSLAAVTRPDYEILVVDNASSDGSVDLVRERYPDVHVIESSENLLYAGGNNLGLQWGLERDFGLFLLLNNDTEVEADFLEPLVRASMQSDRAGIFGSKIFYADREETIWYAGGRVGRWTGTISHEGLRKKEGEWEDVPRRTDYVTGCCLLIRREVLEAIGLLDEGYHMYAEDVDFCLRARKAGFECRYVPESRLWHKISSASGGGLTAYKLYHRIVSTARLFRLHFPWYSYFTLVPVQVFLTLKFLVALLGRGQGDLIRAAIRGIVDLLRGKRRARP